MIINDRYTLILPTLEELRSLFRQGTPANWNDGEEFWTATRVSRDIHIVLNSGNLAEFNVSDTGKTLAAFQVLPLPVIVLNPESMMVDEGITDSTYTVALNTPPTAEVTVTITSDNPDIVTTSPINLTFTALDWNSPKTVTIIAAEDDDEHSGGYR